MLCWSDQQRLNRIEAAILQVAKHQSALLKALEPLMPTLAEVLSNEDTEGVKIDALLAAYKDENAKIADLSAQLTDALANQADPATIAAINDKIAAHVAAIDAILPVSPAAAPAPASAPASDPAAPAA